jgi:hypothetical protein
MAQKKQTAKKGGTTKQSTPKRARNKDGTYKGDDKSTPNVNEAYEQKPGTKATTKPRNPAAKQREAEKTPAKKKPATAKKKPATKKPAAQKAPAKKKHTYAPAVKTIQVPPPTSEPVAPPPLSRYIPPEEKKSRLARFYSWLVGE